MFLLKLHSKELFVPLGLDWLFPFLLSEIFNYNLLRKKKNLYHFFFSSSSGTPIIQFLVHFILFLKSLRRSSILFLLLSLFSSSAVISTIFNYRSQTCPFASNILLWIPFRVFLISLTVLFVSLFLFFHVSRFLHWFLHFLPFVYKVFNHAYYHYSEFFFMWFACFLFISFDFCVSSFFLHFCSISMHFHYYYYLLWLNSPFLKFQGWILSFF